MPERLINSSRWSTRESLAWLAPHVKCAGLEYAFIQRCWLCQWKSCCASAYSNLESSVTNSGLHALSAANLDGFAQGSRPKPTLSFGTTRSPLSKQLLIVVASQQAELLTYRPQLQIEPHPFSSTNMSLIPGLAPTLSLRQFMSICQSSFNRKRPPARLAPSFRPRASLLWRMLEVQHRGNTRRIVYMARPSNDYRLTSKIQPA